MYILIAKPNMVLICLLRRLLDIIFGHEKSFSMYKPQQFGFIGSPLYKIFLVSMTMHDFL